MQRRRQRAGMVLDRISERPERPGRQQVVTRTAENAGAPCGSAPEGSHERRLARAGLTMDQDDRAPALDRVVKRPLEGLKFSCPFEEALAHLVSVAHHATLVDLENTAAAASRPVARPFSLGRPRPRGDPVRRPARYSSRARGSLRYVTGRWRHARVRVGARERPVESRECLEEPDRLECPVAAAYCHLPHHASVAQPFDRIAGRLERASDVSRSSRYREHRQRRKRGDESVCRRVGPYPSEPRP